MAPINTSSQEILAQAAQKLSAAVGAAGVAPNDFAKTLLELLEVSTKINQFDEMASAANSESTSDEAQKWREISLMTMQHAQTHLVEQQQCLVTKLRGLSDSGASLYKTPDALPAPEVKPASVVQPPPGFSQTDVKLNQMAVKPPPGLTTPLDRSLALKPSKISDRKPQSPPGLKPPPGLASAGTAPTTPPDTPPGQKAKKEAAVHPWRMKKQSDKDSFVSFFDARLGKEESKVSNSGIINLDAYESD